MDDMTAFERQIGDELRHEIGPLPRFDAMEIVRATTQSPKWRFQSMFSATKFVVAGVIVALFGGFLLTGVLTTQQGDEMVPAAVTASPETDLLPGVDLVTEAVEPGVERIVSDGIRDLSGVGPGRERGPLPPDGLAVGPDGAVWLDTGSTLVKLGDPDSFPLPSMSWPDLKVSPDGTLWARTGGPSASSIARHQPPPSLASKAKAGRRWRRWMGRWIRTRRGTSLRTAPSGLAGAAPGWRDSTHRAGKIIRSTLTRSPLNSGS